MQELMGHLKVHYRPTQSLEGKAGTPGYRCFGWEVAEGGLKLKQCWWWCLYLQEMLDRHGQSVGALETHWWGCPQPWGVLLNLCPIFCSGKTFQCPTLGCTETLPSMQDLMAHMKVHYKPNRYFK